MKKIFNFIVENRKKELKEKSRKTLMFEVIFQSAFFIAGNFFLFIFPIYSLSEIEGFNFYYIVSFYKDFFIEFGYGNIIVIVIFNLGFLLSIINSIRAYKGKSVQNRF